VYWGNSGAEAIEGAWGWTAFIVVMMFSAAAFAVRGIALVLDGFFDHQ
jgi:hypothetical protein